MCQLRQGDAVLMKKAKGPSKASLNETATALQLKPGRPLWTMHTGKAPEDVANTAWAA